MRPRTAEMCLTPGLVTLILGRGVELVREVLARGIVEVVCEVAFG